MTDPAKEQIRQFIAEHVNVAVIEDDEDLFDSGYVNSLFAVQLMMWIERVMDVQVSRDDLDVATFRTVSAIAAFVARKRAAGAGQATVPAGGHAWTSD